MESEVNPIFIVAHELKSPLAVIRQLALSLDPTQDAQQLARTQHQLISVSERALRQVTDFSKIARLEDGLFQMEPVAIRNVCDEVLREMQQIFHTQRRQLRISYRNQSRLVIANHDLLYSIIYNFCLNAAHYSAPSTISQLSIHDHHQQVRVVVRDYGPALPYGIWRQLKTGTYRHPSPIAMRPSSSGLGLYIATKFANYMHAEIGSIRHKDGASFYVDLPISQQASLF